MPQVPDMAEQRWCMGIEAAFAANEAFDQMPLAKHRYLAYGRVLALAAVNGPDGEAPDPSELIRLECEYIALRGAFADFAHLAGAALGLQVFGEMPS